MRGKPKPSWLPIPWVILFDLGAVLAFCKKYDLWLIEDNCDALGSTYALPEGHPLREVVGKKTDHLHASLIKKTGAREGMFQRSLSILRTI